MKALYLALSLCLAFCLPALAQEVPASAAGPLDEALMSRESADNPLVRIDTTLGTLIVELFPAEAPETVENFLGLAEGSKPFIDPATNAQVTRPFYDGLIFHRVIDGFMIQGGSPTGLGSGGPGYTFRDEINARSLGLDRILAIQEDGFPHPFLGVQTQEDFQRVVLMPLYAKMGITSQEQLDARVDEVEGRVRSLSIKEVFENLGYRYTETVMSRAPLRGVLAMANSGPDTNGSQFFINLADTPWLTGKHTVFGKVRGGMAVLDAIGKVRTDANDRPLEDVVILSIRRVED